TASGVIDASAKIRPDCFSRNRISNVFHQFPEFQIETTLVTRIFEEASCIHEEVIETGRKIDSASAESKSCSNAPIAPAGVFEFIPIDIQPELSIRLRFPDPQKC